jgi:hypothetical protein
MLKEVVYFVSINLAFSQMVIQELLNFKIVPHVLDDASGLNVLNVTFKSENISVKLGNIITTMSVKLEVPDIKWNAVDDKFYTLELIDAQDLSISKLPHEKDEIIHWLVVNIPGSNLNDGETVVQFLSPLPAIETKQHRYIYILFEQRDGKIFYNEGFVNNKTFYGRYPSLTRDLMSEYNLKPIAINFYLSEYDDYVPILYEKYFA